MKLEKRKRKLEKKLERKIRLILSDNETRDIFNEIVDILKELNSSRFYIEVFDIINNDNWVCTFSAYKKQDGIIL